MGRPISTALAKRRQHAVNPELQSWIRNVIVPGLVDAYCGQMKEAPTNPMETLASSREVLRSHERDEEHESMEGTCD